MFLQLQQMQDQLSRQQGIIEELQNDVARMKQESLERYQDLDRRIGTGAPAEAPRILQRVAKPPLAPLQVLPPRKHLRPVANLAIRPKRSSTTTLLLT